MPRSDYSNAVPSASVYSGRTLLGFVIDGDETCIALTPGREFIGVFPDRKSATYAILIHPTGRATPARGKRKRV
jgi:hypothetical protein